MQWCKDKFIELTGSGGITYADRHDHSKIRAYFTAYLVLRSEISVHMYRKSESFLFLLDKPNQGYAWKYNTKSHGAAVTKHAMNKANVMGFEGERRLDTGKTTFNMDGFSKPEEIEDSE
jgi:hypothetical protein